MQSDFTSATGCSVIDSCRGGAIPFDATEADGDEWAQAQGNSWTYSRSIYMLGRTTSMNTSFDLHGTFLGGSASLVHLASTTVHCKKWFALSWENMRQIRRLRMVLQYLTKVVLVETPLVRACSTRSRCSSSRGQPTVDLLLTIHFSSSYCGRVRYRTLMLPHGTGRLMKMDRR